MRYLRVIVSPSPWLIPAKHTQNTHTPTHTHTRTHTHTHMQVDHCILVILKTLFLLPLVNWHLASPVRGINGVLTWAPGDNCIHTGVRDTYNLILLESMIILDQYLLVLLVLIHPVSLNTISSILYLYHFFLMSHVFILFVCGNLLTLSYSLFAFTWSPEVKCTLCIHWLMMIFWLANPTTF